ncbi:hypothetical protein PTKIN_Ptkin14bG0216400 [Pterospermum kingtungense]
MDGASTSSSIRPRIKGCGRRKIEIKRIEDQRKRWVTFSKRKKGLLKKAAELSKLSGEQIGVLIISEQGRVYTSENADSVFQQYQSLVRDGGDVDDDDDEDDIEKINHGGLSLEKANNERRVKEINKGKKCLIDLNKAPEDDDEQFD